MIHTYGDKQPFKPCDLLDNDLKLFHILLDCFLIYVPLGALARAAAIALTALLAEVTVPEIRLGGKMKLYLEI